jgi:hypothetical protein|nr:MAG TPA: hypothetical protein [Caudoviricetes sp.]DAU72603.1 MAG TPA: hypothetical protein [Caudoviricetes sp.]
MIPIFHVGKSLYKALSPILNGKVFSVRAEANTSVPYMVYFRTGRGDDERGDKDAGLANDTHVKVNIYTSTYSEGIKIAENVVTKLLNEENEGIDECTLTDAIEGSTEDGAVFVQSLEFLITI